MVWNVLEKIVGSANDRYLKRARAVVTRVNALEAGVKSLTDDQLREKTAEFRNRHQKGESLDALLPEAFAVVREAGRRVMGMRHFDVQLIGGLALHEGNIAEMRTGEGKTLVATLPAYLNALSGKGVHVVTVNEYLAKRDAEWMGRIHKFLGLDVGVVIHGLSTKARREAYRADITYAYNSELGFDYLRDNMKFALEDYVQRELNFAIVDEVDSILIDEARTPLIISGASDKSSDLYLKVAALMRHLSPAPGNEDGQREQGDYWCDEKSKNVILNEDGVEKLEKLLGCGNLYDSSNIELLHHINNALKAHFQYKRDVDYTIRDGEVMIVDEFTGRVMPGRRWSDGLHQAIEAKEGVEIQSENQTLATITYQNFFRMYGKLSGMTGTASTEAEEFKRIYNLDVITIPTNRPISRKDSEDYVYKTEREKFQAVLADIRDCNERGQPVLVGTVSIEKSEVVANLLNEAAIAHEVLNAKQHAREATIVAQAGRKHAVTISTNMAGRGTDILLGGNPEVLARTDTDKEIADEDARRFAEHRAKIDAGEIEPDAAPAFVSPEEREAIYEKHFARYKNLCETEQAEVRAAGGLHIIGTERHESRRIDNQLRGRAGRQGDPGSSRFYLSFDDDLMRIFGGDRIKNWMERLGQPDGEPIEHKMVTRSIERAQKQVEAHNFEIRKNTIEYDDVMNEQRKTIYGLRREVLGESESKELVLDIIDDVIRDAVANAAPPKTPPEQWNLTGVENQIREIFGFSLFLRGPFEPLRLNLRGVAFDAIAQVKLREKAKSFEAERNHIDEHVKSLLDEFCAGGEDSSEWDLGGLFEALRARFGVRAEIRIEGSGRIKRDTLRRALTDAFRAYFSDLRNVRLSDAEATALRDEFEAFFDAEIPPKASPTAWNLNAFNAALKAKYAVENDVAPQYELARYAIEQSLVVADRAARRAKGDDAAPRVEEWRKLLNENCPTTEPITSWNLDALNRGARTLLGNENFDCTRPAPRDPAELEAFIYFAIEIAYEEKERQVGEENMRHAERVLYLQTIDKQWKDHLQSMDHLRQGIGLRGYGQKDPKLEYKKEGFDLFRAMLERIKFETLHTLFHVQIRNDEEIARIEAKERAEREKIARAAGAREAALAGAGEGTPAPKTAPKTAGKRGATAAGARAGSRPATSTTGAVTAASAASASSAAAAAAQAALSTPASSAHHTVRHDAPRIGANDPCWCGSGKKYKKCHGQPGREEAPPPDWHPPAN